MIKRMKWNVLYGDAEELRSQSSDSSGDSAAVGTEASRAVLHQLASNDMDISPDMERISDAAGSSSDDDGSDADGGDDKAVKSDADFLVTIPSGKKNDVTWRECLLCTGRRLLNDADVEKHLASKRHLQRARKHAQPQTKTVARKRPSPARRAGRTGGTATARSKTRDGSSDNDIDGESDGDQQSREPDALKQTPAKRGGGDDGVKADEDDGNVDDDDNGNDGDIDGDGNGGGDNGADDNDEQDIARRKQKVKKRLRLMRERRWKKRASLESNATAAAAHDNAPEVVARTPRNVQGKDSNTTKGARPATSSKKRHRRPRSPSRDASQTGDDATAKRGHPDVAVEGDTAPDVSASATGEEMGVRRKERKAAKRKRRKSDGEGSEGRAVGAK